jgi:Bacterial membrane protein YfhO
VELGTSVALGQSVNAPPGQILPRDAPVGITYQNQLAPAGRADVDASAYVRPNRIVAALRHSPGRYIAFDPRVTNHRGYLIYHGQGPDTWGLLANLRGMLFRIEDAQGYDPVQLPRYWTFIRAISPKRIDYTAAVFRRLRPVALDLLQVNSLVLPVHRPPRLPLPARPIVRDGAWELYALDHPFPRVSLVTSWQVVGSADRALRAVTADEFNPAAQAILERPPTFARSDVSADGTPESVAYRATGLQSARIDVTTSKPAIVLVRTSYERNWTATVDGTPTTVMPTDYLVQGIPVGSGRHTIVFAYRDPTIGYGLAGSAVSVGLLLGAAAWLAVRIHRRERRAGSDVNIT